MYQISRKRGENQPEKRKIHSNFVSGILQFPDLSHFHGQKSGNKSGFWDKLGCDKLEDALYYSSTIRSTILVNRKTIPFSGEILVKILRWVEFDFESSDPLEKETIEKNSFCPCLTPPENIDSALNNGPALTGLF